MTGIFLHLKHVADLLDRCHEREAMLHANHIHSFAPSLRFAEQFATPDVLAAHRAFKRDNFKNDLWPSPEFEDRFHEMNKELERRRKFENAWEREVDPFRQRYTKMLMVDRDELNRMRRPYEDEREELFLEEVDRFATDLASSSEWSGHKRTTFCQAVFASSEASTGLWRDKKLSTKASPVFSKHMAQDWKVSMYFDGSHLNRPFHPPAVEVETGRKMRHVFPSVDLWINVRPLKPAKEETGKRAGLSFDWVFPIRQEGCVGGYRSFASLHELEAILRIYIKMFQLIEPELEAALFQESADRAA